MGRFKELNIKELNLLMLKKTLEKELAKINAEILELSKYKVKN